jgi:MFS family permease
MRVPRRLPPSLRALAHRDYRRWAGANLCSVVGTWMQVAAQSWLVFQLSGSGAVLGTSVALTALPTLVLGPGGGVVADRFPRRTVLTVTQSLFAVLALIQALAAWRGILTVPLILAASLASGLVTVVDSPTAAAFGSTLVPDEDLANASALGSASGSLGRVVGLSAAGTALAVGGPAAGFGLNAASYLPVIGVLRRLRRGSAPPAVHRTRAWRAMADGLRFMAGTRHLLWLVGLAFVLGALGRNYQVTMAIMVDRVLDGAAGGYAVCSTAFAVGAVLGAVVAAHLRRVTAPVIVAAGAAGAVMQMAAGAAPVLAVFVAVIAGAGATAVVLDTAVSTRFATSVPDHLRGRVLAVAGAAGAGSGALGGPVLGMLAEHLGARAPLLIGGLVCLAACLLLRRRLRDARPVAIEPVPDRTVEGAGTAAVGPRELAAA